MLAFFLCCSVYLLMRECKSQINKRQSPIREGEMELDDLEIQRNVHRVITERIEAICAERGIEKLNHRDIAAECGLSQSVVSLYIKGFMIEARYRQVMRFLSWLGIPPTEFAQKVGLYPSLLQV